MGRVKKGNVFQAVTSYISTRAMNMYQLFLTAVCVTIKVALIVLKGYKSWQHFTVTQAPIFLDTISCYYYLEYELLPNSCSLNLTIIYPLIYCTPFYFS